MSWVFPEYVKLYFQITGTWTDFSSYAVSTFDGEQSIGDSPVDMLAYAGMLRFELNNYDNLFSPEHNNCVSGFGEGTPAKLTVGYNGVENDVFVGRVGKLTFDNEIGSALRAYVTLYDWLEDAANHKIENISVQANKRGDEAIALSIADMDVQPVETDLQQGDNTFDTVLDVSTSETTVYAELQRATASELGCTYLRKDGTLVFEAASYRNGLRELSSFPSSYDDLHPLLTYPNEYILLAESGFPILLDMVQEADFNNSMEKLDLEYGTELVNYLSMWQYPRKVDVSPVVLFTLSEPIQLASGKEIEIKGYYTDPVGGNSVNGQNMSYPSGTRDYQVFKNRDGSGTDLTSSLQFVSVEYGSEGFTHRIKNNNATSGWLTKYKPQGYGVYTYDPTQRVSKNTQSIADRGMRAESLQQRYQRTGDRAAVWGDALIDYHKTPRTQVKAAHFTANSSDFLMNSFLNLNIGSLIRVRQTQRNVDGLFYIQGIKYSIALGGVIVFKFVLKAAFSLLLGLSPIAVELAGGSATDGINFGYLPQVAGADVTKRTFSLWMYQDSAAPAYPESYALMSTFGDLQGTYLYVRDPLRVLFFSYASTGGGRWTTPNNSYTTGTWNHIVASFDASSLTSDPVIYINGVAQTLTEDITPAGSLQDEVGRELIIGNIKSATSDYVECFDGKIKDARVYNRILSQAEVTQLYNGGTPDSSLVTDGLVFRAFSVRTKELSSYINQTLTSELKVIDDIRGAVGTPHGSPIGRNP